MIAGYDDGAGAFARALVGHSDHGDLGDTRMADEDVLDLLGRDVLSVADDDVLRSTGDHKEFVVNPAADVSGAKVPRIVERVGLVAWMQVADQHLRTARSNLAVDDLDIGDSRS